MLSVGGRSAGDLAEWTDKPHDEYDCETRHKHNVPTLADRYPFASFYYALYLCLLLSLVISTYLKLKFIYLNRSRTLQSQVPNLINEMSN